MIKKNRHRAGRKKRERILRAQRALVEEKQIVHRPIVRVNPQLREPIIQQRESLIPLIDLTDELESVNPVPLVNDASSSNDAYYSDNEVEFLEEVPAENHELKPLDPDIEFRHNVTQLFIDLEEYARTIFEISE